MARQQKNNVEYFPHEVKEGKKMHYIESKYGNDGYAVWYKLLAELGGANYHYLDISDNITIMFLSASFKVSEELLKSIIFDIAVFGDFDAQLYKLGILYNQRFVDSIKDAYLKRKYSVINKELLFELLQAKGRIDNSLLPEDCTLNKDGNLIKGNGNTQTKLDNSRVNFIRIGKNIFKNKKPSEVISEEYPIRLETVLMSKHHGKNREELLLKFDKYYSGYEFDDENHFFNCLGKGEPEKKEYNNKAAHITKELSWQDDVNK